MRVCVWEEIKFNIQSIKYSSVCLSAFNMNTL